MAALIGETIENRYLVRRSLGKGGMAEVFEVWDTNRNVLLAMKVLDSELAADRVFLKRFKREAANLRELDHPNIVRTYGSGRDKDIVFLLMDYIEGSTLQKEIFRREEKPYTPDEILEVFRPVCSALQYAHNKGILHCDLKPANIMIDKHGKVLLNDLGVARFVDSSTSTMLGVGTPAYMPPEQIKELDLSPASDIYSLGIILYEMATGGERPFTGDRAKTTTGGTSAKVKWEHIFLPPEPPNAYYPGISPELERIILKCLAKRQEERFQSPMELMKALEGVVLLAGTREEIKLPPMKDPLETSDPIQDPSEKEPPWKDPSEKKSKPKPPPEPAPGNTVVGNGKDNRFLYYIIPLVALAIVFAGMQLFSRKPTGNPGSAAQAATNVLAAKATPVQAESVLESVVGFGGGIYMACTRDEGLQVYYQNVRTGAMTRLTAPAEGKCWEPAVSPNGLVFMTCERGGSKQVYFQEIKTGQMNRLTDPALGQCWDPSPGPNGNLYMTCYRDSSQQVYFQNAASGEMMRLTDPALGKCEAPSASPDGNGIYMACTRDGKREVYYQDAKTGKMNRLTSPAEGECWDPAPTKAGIYMTCNRAGKQEVYFQNIQTGEMNLLTDPNAGTCWDPAPAANGIYLTCQREDGKAEVYFQDIKSGKMNRLTDPGHGTCGEPQKD